MNWETLREIHFHPQTGAPFWRKRAAERNVDVFADVGGEGDFWKLGELSLETLRGIPPDDFLPAGFKGEKMPFESAGTAGAPATTYFTPEEFDAAFVAPFLRAVREGMFPAAGPWLYLGPTGPHAVGRAAERCALASSGERPFTVDFDPRWAKKLPPGSFAAGRYLEHICEQGEDVARKVEVRVLFVTPPVLDALCRKLSAEQRERIVGVQLAGMGVEEEQWARWKMAFPGAKFLLGYGNSLVGVFYPASEHPGYLLEGERVKISLAPFTGEDRLRQSVPNGEKGQVVVQRLDRSALYLNLCERDQAVMKRIGEKSYLDGVSPLPSLRHIKKGFY